jgi:hypothetical protein
MPSFALPARVARWMLCILALIGFASAGRAASVQASLSRDYTAVGSPVRFEIMVEGGRPAGVPNDIRVDGLGISYMGTSHSNQFAFENGRMRNSSKVTISYRVTPEREGTFQIPAISVEVDGNVLRTQPVALRVEGSSGPAGGGGARRGQQQGGHAAPGFDKISFAEVILPKESAYVGETLPVEVRLFVDSRVTWQPETMPELKGEGFTKTKMPEPRQERARRDGREYDVLVFRTAITPSRAGTVQIGPADLLFQAQIPRARPNRRSPLQDFFGDDFFNDPAFSGFGAVERRKATAEAVNLEVKPLPAADKPASFSGAVGKFTLSGQGTPNDVKVGDPITMNHTVAGRGNFDRVNAPVLKDSEGWRTYPPTSNFQPDDEVSYRGAKSFQVAVIPEARKTAMPQFEFSYFDPDTEKYVTLTTEAASLTVKGTPAAPPQRVRKAEPAPGPEQPAPEAPAPATSSGLLGLRYDIGAARSFHPVYEKRWFWLLQLVPASLLLGAFARHYWARSAAARHAADLRRRKSAQLSKLHHEKSLPGFLEAATRVIQLDTAIATGQDPATVDAIDACRSRPLPSETSRCIEELFQARAELLYAGAGPSSSRVDPVERERFVTAVHEFEKQHGRN